MSLNTVTQIDNKVRIKNVLISVFDKSGLAALVNGLTETCRDIRFFSTGGTYTAIAEILGDAAAKKHLISVSDYTGQPEMQGGLVKTLDFKIYLGLLSEKYNEAHIKDIERTSGVVFDMVVVNLYPFKQVVVRDDVTPEQARSNIDIGGPCMIRASAKNYIRVASVTSSDDYPEILKELRENDGCLSFATRFKLMGKAFAHTSSYDTAIAKFFGELSQKTASAAYKQND